MNRDKTERGRDATTLWRRWFAVALAAALAWVSGLLVALFVFDVRSRPVDLFSLSEVAGLPVPRLAADLNPDYRAMIEEVGGVVYDVVQSYPREPLSVAALAQLHNLAHDDEGEIVCWQRCVELDRTCLMAYAPLATRTAERREYAQAESLLRSAIHLSDGSAEFSRQLATVLVSQGKIKDATQVLEDFLGSHPPNVDAQIQLGEAYLQIQETEKAKRCFQAAVRIDSTSSRAYHGLAQVFARLGAKQDAERYRAVFGRLRKQEDDANRHGGMKPSDHWMAPQQAAQILTTAARAYHSQGQIDLTEQNLRRAAELDPEAPTCRTALVDLYAIQGRLEEAVAIVQELREIAPDDPRHLRSLAILLGRLGRLAEAQQCFQELCSMAPSLAAGYAGLAESHLRTGSDLPLAKALAVKAARLEPLAPNFYLLAAVCEKQGDLPMARSSLEKAVALEPTNARYRAAFESLKGNR